MATSDPVTSARAPARASGVGSPWLLAAAAVAVVVQLWGLYRPEAVLVAPALPHVDKVEHALGFAAPVLLVALWLRSAGRPNAVLVAAAFAGHAVVSELIQARFYPTRTGDAADVAADLAGVGVGLTAYALLVRRAR